MKKIVIFGNSSSGKSTLAKKVSSESKLAHLDLDTIAWEESVTPKRMKIEESKIMIEEFINSSKEGWVIEGCYSDLINLVLDESSEIIFMNLPIELCISNARNRPWEPHKYKSKEAQDENLEMLIGWISDYDKRDDTFSKLAHEEIFTNYNKKKTMIVSNSEVEKND